MQPKKQIAIPQLDMFRNRLENILNRQHELYRLSGLIGWEMFEQEFGKLYAEDGRPGAPIRLMVGLTYLGHAYQLSDEEVVRGFLREKNFLVFSPSSYNAVGLGTTQLYKSTLVYNHKRHGVFKLGNREFDFRVKPRFPKKLTPEFLFVDLLNNLNELPEDRESVLQKAQNKLATFDSARLQMALDSFGSMATRKRVQGWLRG